MPYVEDITPGRRPRDYGRRRPIAGSGSSKPASSSRAGHDAPALQDQLGFGAHEHARRSRASSRAPADRSARPTRRRSVAHELGVRQRLRRREVDGAVEVVVLDQPARRRARSPRRGSTTRTAARRRRVPPRPRRTRPSSTSKMPPRSGLIVIAERSATLRVRRRAASSQRALPRARHVDAEAPRRRARPARRRRGCPIARRWPRRSGARRSSPCSPAATRAADARARAMASPTTRVERTRDSRISRRFAARVAAVDAAPGEVDHDVGAVELPRPRARRCRRPTPTSRHGRRARGRRLSTTTSCPSRWNARASTVPTWPDPPGITIFMTRPPSEVDETLALLGPRQRALIEAAEDAVARARHHVVAPVEHDGRAARRRAPTDAPRPAERARDEQRRARPSTRLRACGRPVVAHHIERGRARRDRRSSRDHRRAPRGALQRREIEDAAGDRAPARTAPVGRRARRRRRRAAGACPPPPTGSLRRRIRHALILVNMFTKSQDRRKYGNGRWPRRATPGAAAAARPDGPGRRRQAAALRHRRQAHGQPRLRDDHAARRGQGRRRQRRPPLPLLPEQAGGHLRALRRAVSADYVTTTAAMRARQVARPRRLRAHLEPRGPDAASHDPARPDPGAGGRPGRGRCSASTPRSHECACSTSSSRPSLGATDAPPRPLAEAIGRLLYLVHLAVLLWWLLDKTVKQRATTALVQLSPASCRRPRMTLRLPFVRRFVLVGRRARARGALRRRRRGERVTFVHAPGAVCYTGITAERRRQIKASSDHASGNGSTTRRSRPGGASMANSTGGSR